MKRVESPWDLPDRTVERADEADREIRVSDFALMAVLPFRVVEVAGVPVNELATAALVGLCLLRPARGSAKLPEAVILLLGFLVTLLAYSAYANGIDGTRRVGHVVILCGLVWAGATGRLSVRSTAAGLGAGLVAVVVLGVAGIGGSSYGGRLTGFLGDPNAGAYFLVVLGILAVFLADDRWQVRAALAVPIVAGLVLTYSRTGLLATAFAAAWILAGRRLGIAGGPLAVAGLVWLVGNIPDDVQTFGPFSNRSGSDQLRDRIISQEKVEIAGAPWFGHGPGTARVKIQDLEFFFHNSYLATRQEGGWGALLLVLALLAYAFLRLSARSRGGDIAAAAAQAAIIGVAVMAVTLGEVLLDTPMAIAVAVALGCTLRDDPPEVVRG